MNDKYKDIITLEHYVSPNRQRMSVLDRAAQFAPYAALSGYGDEVEETARLTDRRIELDEGEIEKINFALTSLLGAPRDTIVKITFFRPDKRKAGGAYLTVTGKVENIDKTAEEITLIGGSPINFYDIIDLSVIDSEE